MGPRLRGYYAVGVRSHFSWQASGRAATAHHMLWIAAARRNEGRPYTVKCCLAKRCAHDAASCAWMFDVFFAGGAPLLWHRCAV